jgi:predicted PurR-regulated permease PerM
MAADPKRTVYLPDIPSATLAASTLVVLGMTGLFVLLMQHPQVLLILFAGLFLGIAIKPAVDWLARRRLPQEVGAILIFIALLAVFGIFVSFVLPLLAIQTVNLSTALAEAYAQIRQSLIAVPNLLIRQVLQLLPEDLSMLGSTATQARDPTLTGSLEEMGRYLGQGFNVILRIIFVIFLAVNWSVEGDRLLRGVLLLTGQQREFIRETFVSVENRISRYLTGLGLLSLIVGGLALCGYLIIGLPYALVLAIFAGIMEAVPVIGPAIGAVPAFLVALSISPGAAAAVIVVSILIQAVENIWIFPRVMGSSMGVPPFITLIAMLAFSTLFGIAGAFIAIPIAAVAQVLIEGVVETRRKQKGEAFGRDWISALRYEIQELIEDIRLQMRAKKPLVNGELEKLEDDLEAITLDLDTLLQQEQNEGVV